MEGWGGCCFGFGVQGSRLGVQELENVGARVWGFRLGGYGFKVWGCSCLGPGVQGTDQRSQRQQQGHHGRRTLNPKP